jgi:hypothetical protein
MRRYAKALLLMLVALLYAGTASAYVTEVTGPASAFSSDSITVDVVLDSEGDVNYGYLMNVFFDPAVLTQNGGAYHPIAGENYGSLYLYPADSRWYITSTSFVAAPSVLQSISTLVFHVMDVPGSSDTVINPVVTTMLGAGGFNVGSTVVPLSVHVTVPEPTTTMLMGLGLLGILYAGRRR